LRTRRGSDDPVFRFEPGETINALFEVIPKESHQSVTFDFSQ
jgi:hypothetical protein